MHAAFRKKILAYYRAHGRHDLPWRKGSRTPYEVLVSEIMLQQTQVDRVIPFFKNWLKQFPNFKQLAQASQAEVLKHWKGLGYNSRALRLHKLAKEVTHNYNGKLPSSREELESLPGIGPYTAGAIRVFAFNESDIFIETNIRRVFIHEFFKDKQNISDAKLFKFIEETLPSKNVFEWYSALMDYGSTLPKILKHNPNKQSKRYTKQSKFEGSNRQMRGKILEILLAEGKMTEKKLAEKLKKKDISDVLSQLENEGFITKQNHSFVLVA